MNVVPDVNTQNEGHSLNPAWSTPVKAVGLVNAVGEMCADIPVDSFSLKIQNL